MKNIRLINFILLFFNKLETKNITIFNNKLETGNVTIFNDINYYPSTLIFSLIFLSSFLFPTFKMTANLNDTYKHSSDLNCFRERISWSSHEWNHI